MSEEEIYLYSLVSIKNYVKFEAGDCYYAPLWSNEHCLKFEVSTKLHNEEHVMLVKGGGLKEKVEEEK